MQKIIEFAILIAARVFVECLAAIKTSVAPIKVCPRLPTISGTDSPIISVKYFLYDLQLIHFQLIKSINLNQHMIIIPRVQSTQYFMEYIYILYHLLQDIVFMGG